MGGSVPQAVTLQAFAKVNLTLEVVGKRSDGYHELRSVVQCISLADTVTLHEASAGISLRTCGYEVPSGSDNLCYQAAEAFIKSVGEPPGLDIDLVKRIPAGRGLGGGSSDAAAVLWGLSELSSRPPTAELLHQLAAELGSDVPLFMTGGTLLMKGRGDIVQPLPVLPPKPIFVIAWPALGVSTTEAYGLVAAEDFTDGAYTQALVERIEAGESLHDTDLYNCFQRPVLAHWPVVAKIHERLAKVLGGDALLAGSGSAGLALASDRETAHSVADDMQAEGYQALGAEPADEGSTAIE